MSRTYDPDQAAERQTDAVRASQQQQADWEWLARAPQGRRILAELMQQTGLLQGSMSDSPLTTAYSEGKRAIGQWIYARFTNASEGPGHAALLAEVLTPNHVRRSSSRTRPDRDAG